MPASARPWREAIAALHGLGWNERDIAAAVGISLSTVHKVLSTRFWEVPQLGTCSHREPGPAGRYCDAPAAPGRVYCDQHYRSGWPQ